jgi:hypothetical protein
LAAAWSAGGSLTPIVAAQAEGTPVQEIITMAGLLTAGAAEIATMVLILLGLRAFASEKTENW